ncbi:hypothetical protein B0T21DRAFT_366046 [Apiosordaria backusii]|uniref:GAG-pre-integrase domain-containing protein n=1 Tax=Apiosordaria backusii TaxID=314023 RepID=A0AA40BKP8_9PEZI|nr:hypothetical protein B0T21DRAFT_366046 [Apiosordaria backusii]
MHRRLMHASHTKVIEACKRVGIKVTPYNPQRHQCEWCLQGKSFQQISHAPFPQARRVLAIVHVDSIPHKPVGVGNGNHAIHVIDGKTGYHW